MSVRLRHKELFMLMQINQAWSSLDSREQVLLKALLAFLIVVIMYLLIWAPIISNKQNAQKQLYLAQQEWQWLNEQVNAVQNLPKNGQKPNSISKSKEQLITLLQRSLKRQNLFKDIKTIQGMNQGGKVTFESVNGARLFSWLEQLELQGLVPDKVSITALTPGLVKADIQFKLAR